jgi:hypothetical protein
MTIVIIAHNEKMDEVNATEIIMITIEDALNHQTEDAKDSRLKVH